MWGTVYTIGSFAVNVLLQAVLVAAIVSLLLYVLKLPARIARSGLKKYLDQSRRRHYYQIGLNPTKGRIRRQVRRESAELIATVERNKTAFRSGRLPGQFYVEPWPFLDNNIMRANLGEICPDVHMEKERSQMCRDLSALGPQVTRWVKFMVRLLTFSIALFFAAGWQFNSFDMFQSLGSESAGPLVDAFWRKPGYFFDDGGIAWSNVVGVTISAIVVTLLAGIGLTRLFIGQARELCPIRSEAGDKSTEPGEDELAPLGMDDCTVRTLNFAGGAFDTIMQIGVAHALLVIQGRAPDAVVGVSGSAVNAAAVARVLQAGEATEKEHIVRFVDDCKSADDINRETIGNYWRQLTPEQQFKLQNMRLFARVEELRACIDAAQRAPEKLFDALLPDPYQIESTDPLHPLEMPRFPVEERRERAEATRRQTGLIRLYNHLLNIPFSVGTITRAIRRILGIRAAGDIEHFGVRWAVRINEGIRLWVLLGVNLLYAAPLATLLLRVFRTAETTKTATAGNLIFRFRPLRSLPIFLEQAVVFIVLLVLWVGITLLPFSLGHIAGLIWPNALKDVEWVVTLLFYVVIFVPWALSPRKLSEAERTTTADAISGGFKTLLLLGGLAVFWTSVLGTIVLGSMWLMDLYTLQFPLIDWDKHGWYVVAVLLIPIAIVAPFVTYAWLHRSEFVNRILRSYNLNEALLRVHGLRMFLVDLFDRDYYPRSSMDQIVEDSLEDKLLATSSGLRPEPCKRKLADFCDASRIEPIRVGVAVANTSTGKLEVVKQSASLVDALVAAVSVVPFFPAVEIDDTLYIDGMNVANEPTRALLSFMHPVLNRKARTVYIYSVSPFPMSRPQLGKALDLQLSEAAKAGRYTSEAGEYATHKDAYLNVVNVALRALRLQRFRDATLERRLTELITRAIPAEHSQIEIDLDPRDPRYSKDRKSQHYFRAWMTPIELDVALNSNHRMIGADKEERRTLVFETIADGCRASLQVMTENAIKDTAVECGTEFESLEERSEDGTTDTGIQWIAPCQKVVNAHLAARRSKAQIPEVTLPGHDEQFGPGLSEVCRHCRIWRHGVDVVTEDVEIQQLLEQHDWGHLKQTSRWQQPVGPAWPHEREYCAEDISGDPHYQREDTSARRNTVEKLMELKQSVDEQRSYEEPVADAEDSVIWPRYRTMRNEDGSPGELRAGDDRPTVSFLFSGGVFRGVYQMGVLTALNLLGLKPDVIAGASVGSITAAMVAKTFSIKDEYERQVRIARLAAVYLAVDRIILTDRFADFVRDLTLRAADTHFSIRQADRLFRKYDHPNLLEFDKNARSVVAGLERLLYINPWQLNEFVKNIRNRDYGTAMEQLRDFGQQVLDRASVGDEVLGSEPLTDLITEYVTGKDANNDPLPVKFDDMRRNYGIQFLATTTNLPEGELTILGERPYPHESRDMSPLLSDGLLASSAFPGVFRPRWSWELYPGTSMLMQFIDGGVMDNLPIDAIAQFLYRSSIAGLIERKPEQAPHLVVAASLQIRAQRFALASTRRELRESWPRLYKRAQELKYNTKIDIYQQTEEALRHIDGHFSQGSDGESGFKLLDLEVVAVKPERLCGTFAFHPMLGFRRKSQQESIAHGCASTLLRFADIKDDALKKDYLKGWNINVEEYVPEHSKWADAFDEAEPDLKKLRKEGKCWLTRNPCPFASNNLETAQRKVANEDERLLEKTLEEVSEIHKCCMDWKTHLRKI